MRTECLVAVMQPTGEDSLMDTEREHGQRWAAWLRERLDGKPQKYLVDRSAGAIKPDRISRWLKGQRPDPEAVVLVARILRANPQDALLVAGYDTLAGIDHPEAPPAPVDPLEDEIEKLPISRRAKRLLRERREANIRELRELMAVMREAERRQPSAEPELAGTDGDVSGLL